MEIRIDNLCGTEIRALLEEHLRAMRRHSPPESVHALDLAGLKGPGVTFWSVWDQGQLLGCGALQELDAGHAEIKSMHTAKEHRGKGVAARLVQHILKVAEQRGYHRLSLETGSMAAFEPARALYRRFGFEFCKPFGVYIEDPNSMFMTRRLNG